VHVRIHGYKKTTPSLTAFAPDRCRDSGRSRMIPFFYFEMLASMCLPNSLISMPSLASPNGVPDDIVHDIVIT